MVATTVTTATTTTTAASPELMAASGLIAVVLLMVLLIVKELAGASDHPRAQRLARAVNVGIAPLVLAFGAIVTARVLVVLG